MTIGLSALMIISEGLFLATRNHEYEGMARFWTRLFALTFAMGVATGIVMEFQFGTNWATYSRFVGDVFGAALAAEGIFAFFLESGFLAVVVFGWNKVSPLKHFLATVMVGLGATFSAVWIIVANSWQQTPTGYHVVTTEAGRRAELTDFWAAVLNPSTLDRLVHTLIGAMIMGGFFVLSISAFCLLRGRHEDFAKRSFAIALPFTAFFSLAAAISGHSNAKMVSRYQPGKLAAFEGQFDTAPRAPLHLWGWADEEAEQVRGGLAVPGSLSFLVHGDTAAPIAGLNDPNTVPGGLPAGEAVRDYWPPVNLSFQLYHLMVGLGVAFIVLTVTAMLLLWRGTLFRKRWLLRAFMFAVIGPVIANQAGWAAAEVGRQPWVVWGLL
ncbi:MAG TPA: cytochrome ubiquinol oxidase subunit I [Phycisphaerae bacterium]|nr:cytochrome ubiquinol oxidase subunit I [Phycisphaerae bacterium]HNU45115.1 cytochrome ubiquinol oxidase subunit I [Phycisphaerae bacterium]